MRTAFVPAFLLLFALSASAQTDVSGVVKDSTGGVVAGAAVIARSSSGSDQQTVTGPDGRFTFASVPAGATIVVRASGFAEKSQPAATSLEVELAPATLFESVSVTPTRTEQRLADVPANVSVIDKEQIRRSPAVVSDDVLRQAPTFSLFRRTSSLSSHPTAQGVSLRGIGPSGVSRSLVLIDGIPFNDPFGGWVYWTRVPLENVDRVELVEGSGSSLYGNYAMGGVINIQSTRPRRRTAELRTQYGNLGSPKADFAVSDVWGKFAASLDGSAFKTDGFPIVIENERGLVDDKANVEYRNFNLRADYSPTSRLNVFVRGGYFHEERDNGKHSTIDGTEEANDTTWKNVAGGVRATLPDSSDLQARVFYDDNTFHSNFLAVPNPNRSVGRMTLRQEVPTDGLGAMAQWSKAFSTRYLITAGADFRHVEGASFEQALDAVQGLTVTTRRESGGDQMISGAFVQGQVWLQPNFSVTLSGRLDNWNNTDGRNLETSAATGLPTANNRTLPDKSDTAVSPRAAVLYRVSNKVSAFASIGAGFRAPTLNELYRQFRVGTVLTLANDQLGPERLLGGELGVALAPAEGLTYRSSWYFNRVKNPVANVTVSGAPAAALSTACAVAGTICQQRQNLGRTRITGWQNDVEYRVAREWRVGAGYLFNSATVREFDANPALVGLYLPQVPKHRGSVNLSYSNPRIVTASVTTFFYGRQFDDDLNLRTKPGETEPGLPAYGTMEISALREIGRNLEVFFGVQNLFDTEYYVGFAPTTIGTPRLVNGGLRVRWSGR
ncbi:MAG TPA: TonB-dependent receptor [Vicinamibacterales bacterium]|nr:TonB-dependent receptor [Vicinamibacterales bacterium]